MKIDLITLRNFENKNEKKDFKNYYKSMHLVDRSVGCFIMHLPWKQIYL